MLRKSSATPASAPKISGDGLARALGMLKAREASALIVSKLDRLTRNVRDLADLLEKYFASGLASLISLGENVDTRTAGGRLVLHVLTSVAQWEREANAERTREALQHLRRQGVRMGASGLGWRYSTRNADGRCAVEIVEDEQRVVGHIRELRAAGLTMRSIAATLTAENIPTKRGGHWHPGTIARILNTA